MEMMSVWNIYRILVLTNPKNSQGEGGKMEKPIYYRFGKKYHKLERDEIIKEGAMQAWALGELQPIKNTDGQTIGSTPSDFSPERDFYNPIMERR